MAAQEASDSSGRLIPWPLGAFSRKPKDKLKKLSALRKRIQAHAVIAHTLSPFYARTRLDSVVLEESNCLLAFSALLHGCSCASSTAIKDVHVPANLYPVTEGNSAELKPIRGKSESLGRKHQIKPPEPDLCRRRHRLHPPQGRKHEVDANDAADFSKLESMHSSNVDGAGSRKLVHFDGVCAPKMAMWDAERAHKPTRLLDAGSPAKPTKLRDTRQHSRLGMDQPSSAKREEITKRVGSANCVHTPQFEEHLAKGKARKAGYGEKTGHSRKLLKPGDGHCVHGGVWMKDTIPVVQYSYDPYSDFRDSMLEMTLVRGLKDLQELQDMFVCYVLLNSPCNHRHIENAFRNLLTDLYKCKLLRSGLDENPHDKPRKYTAHSF